MPAWAAFEFTLDGEIQRRHAGALVVDRDHVEWVATTNEDDLRVFDPPWVVDLGEASGASILSIPRV